MTDQTPVVVDLVLDGQITHRVAISALVPAGFAWPDIEATLNEWISGWMPGRR